MFGFARCIAASFMLGCLASPAVALAQSSSTSAAPSSSGTSGSAIPNGVFLSATDASLSAGTGKQITFFVDLLNNTPKIELIHLSVASGPKNWQPKIEDGSRDVSAIELLPSKDDSLTFNVTPPANVSHAPQRFSLKATTDDGLSTSLDLGVTVTNQAVSALKLTTDYSALKGAPGAKFEFTVTIANNSGKDQTFNLSATPPSTDWQVGFQPTASQSPISSIAVKNGATQDVHVEVTAPQDAKPADYSINVGVDDGAGDNAKTPLKVTINGSSKLDLTSTTQQLSTDATAGRPQTVTLVLNNTGNAPAQSVSMAAANVPNGWTVKFNPQTVPSIDPGTTSQVQVVLTPGSKTQAGDYELNFSASSTQASVNKDFRVTIAAPSFWGWVGIGVAVVIVGGLVWMFQGFARR